MHSPGDGGPEARLRSASRISNEAFFDPLPQPCGKLLTDLVQFSHCFSPGDPPLLGGPRRFAFRGSLRTGPHIRVRAFLRSDEIPYLVGNSSGVTRRAA